MNHTRDSGWTPKERFSRAFWTNWIRKAAKEKSDGLISTVVHGFFLLFLLVAMLMVFMLYSYENLKLSIQNALTDTNLAVSTIAVKEAGITGNILVVGESYRYGDYLSIHTQTDEVYAKYRDVLAKNLELTVNAAGEMSRDDFLYGGRVQVKSFIIYNLHADTGVVDVITYNENGFVSFLPQTGAVFTPNGLPVTKTSVYSEITFPVKGYVMDAEHVSFRNIVTADIAELSGVTWK